MTGKSSDSRESILEGAIIAGLFGVAASFFLCFGMHVWNEGWRLGSVSCFLIASYLLGQMVVAIVSVVWKIDNC